MPNVESQVEEWIQKNPVAVFSKSYCPYCTQTKNLLSASGAEAFILELDQVADGSAIQAYLEKKTKQRTVPNVFIGATHIGGNSDLQAKKGELKNMLKEAGAI